MRTGDTILAIATAPCPPGVGTHALIRISGPHAFIALRTLTASPDPPTRGTQTVRLALDSRSIPATLTLFPGPRSYTGEDCAELLLVQNPHLVQRVVRQLLNTTGVRTAEAGEFSARAYLGGKLSLDQAQGIAALIAARSSAEWAAARDLAQGMAGQRHTQWADTIAHLLALTEAGIDFTDQEDVVAIAPDRLAERIEHLLSELESLAPGRLVRTDAVRVALVGPPNAGKSTLFNALLGRRRAITSDRAGTTRDAIIEPLDLMPLTDASIDLIDLPGLDASPVSELDAQARRSAHSVVDAADLILRCDPQGRGTADDRSILVHTQADRSLNRDTQPGVLRVCALDGRGLLELREAIALRVELLTTTGASAASAITPRHAHALRLAAAHLRYARSHVDTYSHRLDHAELIAGELRLALDALAPLVGRIEPDEILGRIFASFCIGK